MHLSSSLLNGLTSSISGNQGRDAAPGADTGKAGGDFSALLSLLVPAKAGNMADTPAQIPSTAASTTDPEAALPIGPAPLSMETKPLTSGSAMPPAAASGKILPAALPLPLPAADIAAEAQPEGEGGQAPAPAPAIVQVAASPALPNAGHIDAEADAQDAAIPPLASDGEEGPAKPGGKTDKAPIPVATLALPTTEAEDIEAEPAKVAVPLPFAIVLPLPVPTAASTTIAANGEESTQGEAAPTPTRLPATLLRPLARQTEAGRDGEQVAAPIRGGNAQQQSGNETPILTLRMAQREQAPATPAETRPAAMERQNMAAPAAQPIRFAPLAEGEKPLKLPVTANTAPASPVVAPIASTPSDSVPAAPAIRAQSHEPMADLTQIVDRLAAAREALAPARAALSIDHAEFGELTLRFEQRHDGRLTAELAGANAEAHRAVAQAMAADRSQTAGGDGGASQQQQQPSSQNMRASTGERDGAAGNGHTQDQRQDTARQRGGRSPNQHQPQTGKGQQQSGVFA